jgi:serine/threonine-protein kinase HipA
MNGQRVGVWRMPARGPTELHYDAAWMASPEGRPVSLSLPFRLDDKPHTGAAVAAYFDNLLPDADHLRRRLAARFKVSTQPFDLLAAVGRDCVGALQLVPEGWDPGPVDRIEGKVLSEAGVAAALRAIAGSTPALGTDAADDELFRLSLAGSQEKTALLRHRGRWLLPRGTTPTTHIFKLPLGRVGNRRADMRTSVENEWLCARILRAYGLPIAACEIATFEDQKALVVERFDRRQHASGTWWLRLPQEDFCQVFAVPPHRKYETDGGPSLEQMASVLRNSVAAAADMATLMRAQLVFYLLAATDGHAKNFSLRLLPQGRYQLAPLYDVLSAWPIIGEGPARVSWHKVKLALSVRGRQRHYGLKTIARRHFNAMAPACLLAASAEPLIEDILARTAGAIEQVQREVPDGFPARVLDTVLSGLRRSAERLASMAAA